MGRDALQMGPAMRGRDIRCARCKAVIGIWPGHPSHTPHNKIFVCLPCPGTGKHKYPKEEVVRRTCLGFIEEFRLIYEETKTSITHFRYTGPPFLLCFVIGIVFGVTLHPGEKYKRIRLSGKTLIFTPHARGFWKRLREFFRGHTAS